MFQRLALAVAVLFACALSSFARPAQQQPPTFYSSPFTADLEIWGVLTHDEKIIFYQGWASGLFTTTKDPGTLALGSCLQEKLNWELVLPILDKWHADHRENWHKPMSPEMIKALTAAGSPCAGISVGS